MFHTILALTIYSPTASTNTLSELEQKKQEEEQQQQELNSGINQKSNELSVNQTNLEKILEKIQLLENEIQETVNKVTDVEEKIDQTIAEIDVLKESIAELERKITEREDLLKERARAIQLSGGSVDDIDDLLGANSFVDFIDRFSAVNTLIEADREIMLAQSNDTELLADQQAEVETKLASQEERHQELGTLKDSLDVQKNEQATFVKELKKEQKRLSSEKNVLGHKFEESIAVSAEVAQQIKEEQARLAELARQAEIARKAEEERQLAAEKKVEEERLATERKATARETERQQVAEQKAAKKHLAVEREAEAAKEINQAKTASAPNLSNREDSHIVPAASANSPFIRPAAGGILRDLRVEILVKGQ